MNIPMEKPPRLAINLLRMSVAYLLLGLLLGIAMAASHQFELRPVHTHLNLLGWTTMALTGVVYSLFPRAAASRFATGHYWLHTLGLPVMMVGLAAYSLGRTQFEPVIAAGSLLITLGLLLFAITTYTTLSGRAQPAMVQNHASAD